MGNEKSSHEGRHGSRHGRQSRQGKPVSEEFEQKVAKAKQGLSAFGERLRRGASAGRHRVEASLMRRERARLMERVGDQVSRLVEEGRGEGLPPEVVNLCDRITQLRSMAEREEESARSSWEEMRNYGKEPPATRRKTRGGATTGATTGVERTEEPPSGGPDEDDSARPPGG